MPSQPSYPLSVCFNLAVLCIFGLCSPCEECESALCLPPRAGVFLYVCYWSAARYPAAIASHAPIPGSMGLFLRIPRRVQAVPSMYSDLFKLFLSSYLFLTFKELRLQFLQKVQHTNHLIFRGLLFHSYFTNSLHC